MKHSESIAKLASALVAAQGEVKAVGKDRTNPHFKNRYVTLDALTEAVRPILTRHNIALVQGATVPHTDETGAVRALTVETMLVHESGEWLTNAVVMPLDKATPQGAGSAVTYGRRYGLAALLALTSDEDDDGQAASTPTKPQPKKPEAKPVKKSPEDWATEDQITVLRDFKLDPAAKERLEKRILEGLTTAEASDWIDKLNARSE